MKAYGLVVQVGSDTDEEWEKARREGFVIRATMPCGSKLELSRDQWDEVVKAHKDVPCPCGNPEHVLIAFRAAS